MMEVSDGTMHLFVAISGSAAMEEGLAKIVVVSGQV